MTAAAATTAAAVAASATAAAGIAVSAGAVDDDDHHHQINVSIHTNNYTPKINSNQTMELANYSNWPNDASETIEMLDMTRTKRSNANGREKNGHHINQ